MLAACAHIRACAHAHLWIHMHTQTRPPCPASPLSPLAPPLLCSWPCFTPSSAAMRTLSPLAGNLGSWASPTPHTCAMPSAGATRCCRTCTRCSATPTPRACRCCGRCGTSSLTTKVCVRGGHVCATANWGNSSWEAFFIFLSPLLCLLRSAAVSVQQFLHGVNAGLSSGIIFNSFIVSMLVLHRVIANPSSCQCWS